MAGNAFPYVWNDEQTEAFTARCRGQQKKSHCLIKTAPRQRTSPTSCRTRINVPAAIRRCTTDGDMHPLGALFSQLDVDVRTGIASPLEQMVQRGWLNDEQVFPRSESWQDLSAPLDDRALDLSEYAVRALPQPRRCRTTHQDLSSIVHRRSP